MIYTKEELVSYRFKRSEESLEEAKILAHANHWNAVINRLYYAAYYSVSAYLIKNDIQPGSHNGTKTLFHQELIKSGKLRMEEGKLYSSLFDKRHEGDYGDFQEFNREQTEPLISKVEDFLKNIKKLLSNNI
jgi:uncharacterized protein (UPF0332 family)